MNREDLLKLEVEKAKTFLEDKGYNVAFIWIYWSQNYDLDVNTPEYQSDIDFKAVIIPTLDDLVYNAKPKSTTLTYGDWQIDLKDIRVFTDTLVKCNPAYVEILYSDFSIYTDDFEKIINERENLVAEMWQFLLRASYGMIVEKVKAFSHPYPTIKDKIDKYGYDPKQAHHIVRLYYLMRKYIETWKFDVSNNDTNKRLLMDIKLGKFSLPEAEYMRDEYQAMAMSLREEYEVEPIFDTKNKIVQLSKDVVRNSIVNDINGWMKCPVCKNEFKPLPNM